MCESTLLFLSGRYSTFLDYAARFLEHVSESAFLGAERHGGGGCQDPFAGLICLRWSVCSAAPQGQENGLDQESGARPQQPASAGQLSAEASVHGLAPGQDEGDDVHPVLAAHQRATDRQGEYRV